MKRGVFGGLFDGRLTFDNFGNTHRGQGKRRKIRGIWVHPDPWNVALQLEAEETLDLQAQAVRSAKYEVGRNKVSERLLVQSGYSHC